MPSSYFAVRRRHGAGWDDTRGLREQRLWTEHAALMDAMVAEGFIVLGGPVGDAREVLLVFDAPSEDLIHERLHEDPWPRDGLLVTTRVEPWTVLLDRTAPLACTASGTPQPVFHPRRDCGSFHAVTGADTFADARSWRSRTRRRDQAPSGRPAGPAVPATR